MFGSLGTPEIVIIGVVLILLFGVGKLSGLGKDLGGSVKEFRRAVKDDDAEKTPPVQASVQTQVPPAQQPPAQPTSQTKSDNQPGIF